MAHAFLDHSRPFGIAHRGGSLEHDENTMFAFRHAVALGFRHLELDVRLSRDGQVVVHHDPDLARMTGDPREVAAMDWADLRGLTMRGGGSVPLLAEVLESLPETFVNIEAKSDDVVAPLATLLRSMKVLGRVCVGSFEPRRTQALRADLGPTLCWSPAHSGVLGLWLRGWHLPVPLSAFKVVQVPRAFRGIEVVTPRFVRAAHKAGIQVQVWTVNDRAEMETLLDRGVDALMTDRPTLLREVLRARGAWRD